MERSLRPFSESFSDIQILRGNYNDTAAKEAYESLILPTTLSGVNVNEISQNGLCGEQSFLIEHITDIKSIDPEWQDDEIEVLSFPFTPLFVMWLSTGNMRNLSQEQVKLVVSEFSW